MKINTRFNVDETAYILSQGNCYKVKVVDVAVDIQKDDEGEEETTITYTVDKFIPKGLLKTETERDEYDESRLFASKKECENILESLAKAKKEKEELTEKIEGLEKACGNYCYAENGSTLRTTFSGGWSTYNDATVAFR